MLCLQEGAYPIAVYYSNVSYKKRNSWMLTAGVATLDVIYCGCWTVKMGCDSRYLPQNLHQKLRVWKASEFLSVSTSFISIQQLPICLFSSKIPDNDKSCLADKLLSFTRDERNTVALAPQQRFGAGFGEPEFPQNITVINPCWSGSTWRLDLTQRSGHTACLPEWRCCMLVPVSCISTLTVTWTY